MNRTLSLALSLVALELAGCAAPVEESPAENFAREEELPSAPSIPVTERAAEGGASALGAVNGASVPVAELAAPRGVATLRSLVESPPGGAITWGDVLICIPCAASRARTEAPVTAPSTR
jgi:hypothetical protein